MSETTAVNEKIALFVTVYKDFLIYDSTSVKSYQSDIWSRD